MNWQSRQTGYSLDQTTLERYHKQLLEKQIELNRKQTQLQAAQNRIQQDFLNLESYTHNRLGSQEKLYSLSKRKLNQLINTPKMLRKLWVLVHVKGLRYTLIKLLEKSLQFLKEESFTLQEVVEGIPESDNQKYQYWLFKNYPREADLKQMTEVLQTFTYKPFISIIMPVFNPPRQFLQAAIESVLNQVYPYWEFCIADDASTELYVKPLLKKYASQDSRIKVIFRTQNGHISQASNSALAMATGEFITLLDHDDLLTPDALYEVALLLNRYSDADMIYSDEDKIQTDGKLSEPFFKPEWCPETFLSRMYTGHLGVYRRTIVNEIGGFREGYEGSQDYDLVLRFTEKTQKIFHIPKILYHWRIHSNSTAHNLLSKNYAADTAQKALRDALQRRKECGKVIPVSGGHHIIRYEIKAFKLVTIIIPTKNLGSTLENCLKSIFEKTEYPNYEVLVIDNGSTEKKAIDVINYWKSKEPNRFRCEVFDAPFNFSKINNFASELAKGDYFLFLNNDTEVLTPDWVNAMVEYAQRPCIGAVGALLLYPDNTIQHAGIVCVGGVAGHSHKHYHATEHGYFNQIQTVNNYLGVTAACLMCRREVFEQVDGLEEDLAVAFNDVDFCFKLFSLGYRNVYLPHVILYHHESKSRGYENNPQKRQRFQQEFEYMQRKWKDLIDHDPCYSPHLTKKREDFSIAP